MGYQTAPETKMKDPNANVVVVTSEAIHLSGKAKIIYAINHAGKLHKVLNVPVLLDTGQSSTILRYLIMLCLFVKSCSQLSNEQTFSSVGNWTHTKIENSIRSALQVEAFK